jgi:iron complex outermembrane receptor protein
LDLNKNFPTVLKGLNVAIGGELRAERFTILAGEDASWKTGTASPTLAAGAQVYGGFFPNNAGENKRLSGGAYTDIELDILKSSTVNWMVGGAARWENYSDFGNQIFNYKGTTALRFFEGLFGVRGTYQTGFRAPSLQQKYFTKTTTKFITDASGNLVPQESGVFANNSVAAEIAGIPNLKQETSTAYSFGLTTRPIKGLEMTVDAYQIDIKDRIVLTGDFAKAEFPVAAQPILTAAGASVASFFTNAVNTRSQGAELVLAYSKTFASVHDVRIAFAGSYIQNIVEKDELGNAVINNKGVFPTLQSRFFTREDIARVEYGNPAQKANLTLNYKWNKKFGLMFRANYFGAVVYNDARYITASAPEANFAANAYDANTKQTLDQSFSPKTTFDMSLNYQLTPALGITVGGTNITDVYPDVQTHSGNVSAGRFVYSRRVQQFGFNGAYYFARLNFNIGVKK